MLRRARHAFLILMGRAPLAFSTEELELYMTLDKFNAAVASLNAAADALIAKASSDASALAQAQSDLEAADSTASAAVQSVTGKINAAVPGVPPTDTSAEPTP